MTDSDDPETVDIAKSILNSGNRMSRMVNDLLDLTRTRLGAGIPVTLRPTDLLEICNDVVSELKAMHPKAQIFFESNGSLIGNWDGDRLAQVISNLISNALQYGDIEKPITVRAQGSSHEVSISVHNEGPAIPAKLLKTIFVPMARHLPGGHKVDNNVTGLGLGLYIANEIVASHKGVVEVASNEQTGTSFTIKLHRDPESMSTPRRGNRRKQETRYGDSP